MKKFLRSLCNLEAVQALALATVGLSPILWVLFETTLGMTSALS